MRSNKACWLVQNRAKQVSRLTFNFFQTTRISIVYWSKIFTNLRKRKCVDFLSFSSFCFPTSFRLRKFCLSRRPARCSAFDVNRKWRNCCRLSARRCCSCATSLDESPVSSLCKYSRDDACENRIDVTMTSTNSNTRYLFDDEQELNIVDGVIVDKIFVYETK